MHVCVHVCVGVHACVCSCVCVCRKPSGETSEHTETLTVPTTQELAVVQEDDEEATAEREGMCMAMYGANHDHDIILQGVLDSPLPQSLLSTKNPRCAYLHTYQ